MTPKQRVISAIQRTETDKLPIDLGGTDSNGVMVGPYVELCRHFNIDPFPIYMPDFTEQCVTVDERLCQALGCNTDSRAFVALPNKWREYTAYNGTTTLVPEKFRPQMNDAGDEVIFDRQGRPSLKKPAGGFFFDVASHPLQNVTSTEQLIDHADLIRNYDKSDLFDMSLQDQAKEAKKLQEQGKYVVAPILYHLFSGGQFLRGWSDFLLDLGLRTAFAEALLDRMVEGHMQHFEKFSTSVGKYVDAIQLCDDYGMQNNTWISPSTYRKHIKPYQAKLYAYIKKLCPDKALILHSCGSIREFIPDFIEIGVDVLNPVQYTAKNMKLTDLKRDFGNDICFWGGGIDTQHLLPFGTPQEVADEVKRNIDIMAPGGGFIFTQIHNITQGVPIENVIAAYHTASEYAG